MGQRRADRPGDILAGERGSGRRPRRRALAPSPSFKLSKDVLVTIASGVEFGDVKGKALQIEAVWFCEQFIRAARQWAIANGEDLNVSTNMPNLVRFGSNGLPPYIIGVPLIARAIGPAPLPRQAQLPRRSSPSLAAPCVQCCYDAAKKNSGLRGWIPGGNPVIIAAKRYWPPSPLQN
jgi:hypothetical protein